MTCTVSGRNVSHMSSHRANQFQVAMHRRYHQGRYPRVVRQVAARSSIEQSPGDNPFLPQNRREKQRPIIRSSRVWILVLAKVTIDQ